VPRIRTIKPEYWEDEAVGALTFGARLLFIASWNLADDEGLLRWTPAYLKASVFIYDDDIGVSLIESFMEEVAGAGLVFPYQAGKAKERLGYVINFRKHQVINRPSPSKLMPPSVDSPKVWQMYAERDGWVCHICSERIPPRNEADDSTKLTIDHVIPRSKGGSDAPSNVKSAHSDCNSRKGSSLTESSVNTHGGLTEDSVREGKGREWKGRERKAEREGSVRGGDEPFKTEQPSDLEWDAAIGFAIDRGAKDPEALATHLWSTPDGRQKIRQFMHKNTPIDSSVRNILDGIAKEAS